MPEPDQQTSETASLYRGQDEPRYRAMSRGQRNETQSGIRRYSGGRGRDRTGDSLLAKPLLETLSTWLVLPYLCHATGFLQVFVRFCSQPVQIIGPLCRPLEQDCVRLSKSGLLTKVS